MLISLPPDVEAANFRGPSGVEAILRALIGQDVSVEFDRGDADDPWWSATATTPFGFSGVITDVVRDADGMLVVEGDYGMAFAVAENREVRICAADVGWCG